LRRNFSLLEKVETKLKVSQYVANEKVTKNDEIRNSFTNQSLRKKGVKKDKYFSNLKKEIKNSCSSSYCKRIEVLFLDVF